jgi:hypothetical protein
MTRKNGYIQEVLCGVRHVRGRMPQFDPAAPVRGRIFEEIESLAHV